MLTSLASGVLLLAATCATALWITHADDPRDTRCEDFGQGLRTIRTRLPGTFRGRLAAGMALTALSTSSTLLHPCWIQPFLVLAVGSVAAALGCIIGDLPHRGVHTTRHP